MRIKETVIRQEAWYIISSHYCSPTWYKGSSTKNHKQLTSELSKQNKLQRAMLPLSSVFPLNPYAKRGSYLQKGNCLLICLHCILFFHNQGRISRSQNVLPLKEKTDTNFSTSTVVLRLEMKKKPNRTMWKGHTRTGRDIRETILMSYTQLSAEGGKAHVLKIVLQSHKNKK